MVGKGGAAGCACGCGVEGEFRQGVVFGIEMVLVSGVVEAGFGGAVGPGVDTGGAGVEGVDTGGAGVEEKKNGVDSSKCEVLDVFH